MPKITVKSFESKMVGPFSCSNKRKHEIWHTPTDFWHAQADARMKLAWVECEF